MPDFGRKDYNDNYESMALADARITDEIGALNNSRALEMIPADEPVFLLRASDEIAVDALRAIVAAYQGRVQNDLRNPTLISMSAHLQRFITWQTADDTGQMVKLGDVPS